MFQNIQERQRFFSGTLQKPLLNSLFTLFSRVLAVQTMSDFKTKNFFKAFKAKSFKIFYQFKYFMEMKRLLDFMYDRVIISKLNEKFQKF